MSEAANAPEGLNIDGRYRIVRKIADGGMATVYQAVDERLDRTVAIKIMHMQLAQGPHRQQFVERFRREAKSAAAIANPHIVQVYDTGEYQGLDFLVMEYVHGVNLRKEMNQQRTFTVRETLRIITQTLDGLASAHRAGVVHRDIKPENILLNERGHVQITDFGLSKAASQATLSSTGMLLGTAAYLAPEMIESNSATQQGDLYSVGIMAWEMLAGEVPFVSDNPVTLVFKHVHEDVPSITVPCPGIDPSIAEFIAHLTARSVDARPKDATEALREIRALSARLPIMAWQYRKPDSQTLNASVDSSGKPALAAAPIAVPPIPPADAQTLDHDGTIAVPIREHAAQKSAPIDPADSSNADVNNGNTQVLGLEESAHNTQIMPAVRSTSGSAAVDNVSNDADAAAAQHDGREATAAIGLMPAQHLDEESIRKRKRRKRNIIIAAILSVVLIATAATGAWWYWLGPGSYWTMPQPSDLTCTEGQSCTITNVSWSSYESSLKVAGIPYTVQEDYSDTIAKGNIISTTPETVDAHVSKRRNEQVTVTVSQGVKQATIPTDITDANSANGKDPIAALTAAGFTAITHDAEKDDYSLTIPSGAVASISPDPGTTMDHNKEIVIQLSKGPMPVSMPDVVGHSKDEAQNAFDTAKLKANYTESFSDTVANGDIISTSVAAGTQLHWGDSVDVVVSKGPEMVTLPDVRGKSTEDAKSTLEALGLQVQVSAPLGDLTHTVRLQSPDPGQQVRVRDEQGNKTVITLTVV